jgi:hypothetical protein
LEPIPAKIEDEIGTRSDKIGTHSGENRRRNLNPFVFYTDVSERRGREKEEKRKRDGEENGWVTMKKMACG